MHVLDSLTQTFQILNAEKQTVYNITDRTVDLKKTLASLQTIVKSKLIDFHYK